jgi:hypothetical protein
MELFGEDHNMRPGWVTVGKNISTTNFKAKVRGPVSQGLSVKASGQVPAQKQHQHRPAKRSHVCTWHRRYTALYL